jgi:NADP-dependent 3-hydroxy acid dehydrogenase YdfG
VAVVTGAASGIGFAVAARAAAEGMTVVLADIDTGKLRDAAASLRGTGSEVHSVWVDVSDRESVADLARRVREDAGDAWLLVNNAGVYLSAPFTQMPPADWEFVVGVNLWGVVHCMQAFLPGMVERDSGHVVNTSSIDGLVTVRNAAGYVAAKHAVSALSETVYRELEEAGSSVGISVLCPAAVATDILNSGRHRPSRLGPAASGRGTRLPAAGRRDAAGPGRRHHVRRPGRAPLLDPDPPRAGRTRDPGPRRGHRDRSQPRR